MKSKKEIQDRINILEEDLLEESQWHEKAQEEYSNKRKFFGQYADNGEMIAAAETCRIIRNEINTLKWVLEEEK